MTADARPPKRLLPNPFYVLVLAASTLFVVTTFGYLVSPYVPRGGSNASGRAAEWLDRRGPLALGVEVVVMIAAGGLAMATDRKFPERPGPRPAD